MNGIKKINEIRKYCDYVEEHLLNVQKAWNVLKEECKNMRFISDDFVFFTIDQMIQEHDLSKLSHQEFIQYSDWFFSDNGKEWESLDAGAEMEHIRMKQSFDLAWNHHEAENGHHWQNWTTKKFYHPYEAECHCVCMVCDWMAMGMKFGDTAEEYYKRNESKIPLSEWSVSFIQEIFDHIRTNTTKGKE